MATKTEPHKDIGAGSKNDLCEAMPEPKTVIYVTLVSGNRQKSKDIPLGRPNQQWAFDAKGAHANFAEDPNAEDYLSTVTFLTCVTVGFLALCTLTRPLRRVSSPSPWTDPEPCQPPCRVTSCVTSIRRRAWTVPGTFQACGQIINQVLTGPPSPRSSSAAAR